MTGQREQVWALTSCRALARQTGASFLAVRTCEQSCELQSLNESQCELQCLNELCKDFLPFRQTQ